MEKHDLHHEFPELSEKIHALKVSDNHFKKLFDEYHDVNNQVHSIETGAMVTADETLDKLRTHRVYLKDELYRLLNG
jgi:uncharacterized protein YdcH (DUF465 family)